MTSKERKYVKGTVENEGFDYAFASYSNFGGEAVGEPSASLVKDPKFHRLRETFLAARTALIDYVGLEDC